MLHTPSGNEENWKLRGAGRSWSPVCMPLWFSRQEMMGREVGRMGRYSEAEMTRMAQHGTWTDMKQREKSRMTPEAVG